MAQRHRGRDVPQRTAALLREASWEERAVDIAYRDEGGRLTERRIQPLAVAYLDETLPAVAWCRLREGFRRFRLDRIEAASPLEESVRPRRAALLRDYVATLS